MYTDYTIIIQFHFLEGKIHLHVCMHVYDCIINVSMQAGADMDVYRLYTYMYAVDYSGASLVWTLLAPSTGG